MLRLFVLACFVVFVYATVNTFVPMILEMLGDWMTNREQRRHRKIS